MKKLKILMAVFSVAVSLVAAGCSDGVSEKSIDNSGNSGTTGSTTGDTTGGSSGGDTGGTSTPGTGVLSSVVKSGLKFDFSNAKAIAAVDRDSLDRAAYSRNARAAEDSSIDDSPLLKILENGSFESAITMAENANLATVKEIYKSPLEDSNDIFIVLNGQSWFYETKITVDENGNEINRQQEYKTLGQLICIHEDNTIADILKINNDSNSYNNDYQNLEIDKGIKFDNAGNLYYMAQTYDSSNNYSVIYKFNPKTNEITQLTASVAGTEYNSFKITGDGQIIFVEGSRWQSGSYANFLRAIPVNNPNNIFNIYYSSSGSSLQNWVYDENNEIMYYISGNGLYKSLRNGNSFKDGEFIADNTALELYYGSYFNMQYTWPAYWNTNELNCYNGTYYVYSKIVDDDGTLIPENVVNYIVGIAKDFSSSYYCISTDDVDVRFDVFKNIEGYEDIYNVTKGLKNADAIKALDTFKLRNLLYNVFWDGYYSYSQNYISSSSSSGYKHNFLADILYVKGTDTLLCNSDKPVNSSTEIKGTEYFTKNSNYYNNNGDCVRHSLFNDNTYKSGFTSVNNSYLKADGSADCQKILNDAFSKCNTHGEKEFRLDCFKNDETYGMLYSELKDEAALEWLTSDDERLFWFGNAVCESYSRFYNLFFIKGTDEPAYKSTEISTGYCWDIKDYTVSNDGSLWGRYTNTDSSYSSEKYFYFVKIIDSDGCLINEFNKVDLPEGKVSQTIENDGSLYMKYSLLNKNGDETGFHQIYKVDFSDSNTTNLFKNVPNNERLEVVSFSVGADRLYYSAVRGTSVENGEVCISTNEYNPLTITKKLSAIYTF